VFSLNYSIPLSTITGSSESSDPSGSGALTDTKGTLAAYTDRNTASGNEIQRHFCKACGSPVYTTTPAEPDTAYLKATLFDDVAPIGMELFQERKG
jgi:hypothetical protein